MFDFTEKRKEKYFRKAEKLLAAAGLTSVEIDRTAISIVRNEMVKVYTKKFTWQQVSAEELKKLKQIDNFIIVVDRDMKTKEKEKQLCEYGYFSLRLMPKDR